MSIPAPAYTPRDGGKLACMVDMRDHMTSEGHEIALALEHGGYTLAGHNFPEPETDVRVLVQKYNPGTVVIQDKREWMGLTADKSQDPAYRFTSVEVLKERNDIFKCTILKDAHRDQELHEQAANEIGCHAWIVYYDVVKVVQQAPYVRRENLIRTYHTVDKNLCPEVTGKREGILLSGALNGNHYPFRRWISQNRFQFQGLRVLRHPGYHRRGSNTPGFLQELSKHKVAICTASRHGYALRKIIEATACGCIVLTDLQTSDHLPLIDGNLVRVDPAIGVKECVKELRGLLSELQHGYNIERQRHYAECAKMFYDFRAMGSLLAQDIEQRRLNYVHAT